MATIHDMPNEIICMITKGFSRRDRWCLSRASGPLFNAVNDDSVRMYTRRLIDKAMFYARCLLPWNISAWRDTGHSFRIDISDKFDTTQFTYVRIGHIYHVKKYDASYENMVAQTAASYSLVTGKRTIQTVRNFVPRKSSTWDLPDEIIGQILAEVTREILRSGDIFHVHHIDM